MILFKVHRCCHGFTVSDFVRRFEWSHVYFVFFCKNHMFLKTGQIFMTIFCSSKQSRLYVTTKWTKVVRFVGFFVHDNTWFLVGRPHRLITQKWRRFKFVQSKFQSFCLIKNHSKDTQIRVLATQKCFRNVYYYSRRR